MQEPIELIIQEKRQPGGISVAVGVSLVVHALFAIWIVAKYKPMTAVPVDTPMTRYVELIKQTPKEFTEAPGPRVESAPITAAYSDANRRASMPEPTGDRPAKRPGDDRGLYTPPMRSGDSVGPPTSAAQPRAAEAGDATENPADAAARQTAETRITPYIESSATSKVDWRSAIKEVGRVASLGGAQSLNIEDLGGGGEKGFAEAGPLSFETQWYDWGEYAQSMVSRIRVNWYEQMPPLIRTGMKGQVTIRFTILRDGRITNVHIVKSSDIPPYDFAAKKAIELSSPLNPLPKDFPNDSERVTAMFYYNMAVPARNRREGR